MVVSRLALVVVAMIAAALVCVSAVQISVPPAATHTDGGWCGPHPSQLVSFSVDVTTSPSGWGMPVTVVPSVPRNGLVVTGITACPQAVGGSSVWVQLNENTTTQKLVVSSKNGSSTGYSRNDIKIGLDTGLPIAAGSSLSVRTAMNAYTRVVHVTITGYVW